MKPVDVLLRDAIGVLETKGWCQGAYRDGSGRCCAIGSFYEVTKNGDEIADLTAVVSEVLHGRREYRGIVVWNDVRGRTRDEVVAVFREAMIAAAGAA